MLTLGQWHLAVYEQGVRLFKMDWALREACQSCELGDPEYGCPTDCPVCRAAISESSGACPF